MQEPTNPYRNSHRKRLWRLGLQDAVANRAKDADLIATPFGSAYERGYQDGQPKAAANAG